MEELKPSAAVVVAVAHKSYRGMSIDTLNRLMNKNPVLVDVKCIFDAKTLERSGVRIWQL